MNGSTAVPCDPACLREWLERAGKRYALLSTPGGVVAEVRFTGRYQGRDVVWQAQLLALQCAQNQHLQPQGEASQFMEIGAPEADVYPITVGLAVPRIDESVVAKAVIMIQKYKRLRDGRYEFGPPR